METDVALLERLAQIDNEKTLNFIKNKKDLLGRHWSNIVPLFSFLKKHYSKQIIEKYIEENIIKNVHAADHIYLLGPGEAKVELKNKLEQDKHYQV